METNHLFSLQVGNNRVWDYVRDNYVHRLLQSEGDGKVKMFQEAVRITLQLWSKNIHSSFAVQEMTNLYSFHLTWTGCVLWAAVPCVWHQGGNDAGWREANSTAAGVHPSALFTAWITETVLWEQDNRSTIQGFAGGEAHDLICKVWQGLCIFSPFLLFSYSRVQQNMWLGRDYQRGIQVYSIATSCSLWCRNFLIW